VIGALWTFGVCLLLPSFAKPRLLALAGHRVQPGARVRPCFVWRTRLHLEAGARIGVGNVLACRRLVMRRGSYLGIGNFLSGPFSVVLAPTAALGNFNIAKRPAHPISMGPSTLRLGVLAKFTAAHYIDCMSHVALGDYSTFAGRSSQVWTHGYVHASRGADRVRVQGPIAIGDNVYIGSRCVVLPCVTVTHGVTVGSGAVVSKDILQEGMYVSQALRRVETDFERLDLIAVRPPHGQSGDKVVLKAPTRLPSREEP
jgi:acetyltransferase-like isoleucine patch superfamily enzyme